METITAGGGIASCLVSGGIHSSRIGAGCDVLSGHERADRTEAPDGGSDCTRRGDWSWTRGPESAGNY